MASKILVDELAPQSHATDVTLTTGKNITGANTQFKITGGSNTNVLTTDGSGGLTWGAAGTTVKHSVLCEEQTSGTDGGTFTSGAWQIRTLNSEIFDDIGITITASVFTLPAGTFYIRWRAPAFGVTYHMSRLYDVDGTAVVEYGTTAYDQVSSANDIGASVGFAKVTPGSPTQYRIEHRATASYSTTGFGRASSLAVEKYTVVEIEQHA
jgi:hypothetical protein